MSRREAERVHLVHQLCPLLAPTLDDRHQVGDPAHLGEQNGQYRKSSYFNIL